MEAEASTNRPKHKTDTSGGDSPPTKKQKDRSTSDCSLCSQPAIKDTLECGWCECLKHSACLGLSADHCNVLNTVSSNVMYFCDTCLIHLPAAMQTYENRESDNEKLITMEEKIVTRLDTLESKFSGVTKQLMECSLAELSNQIDEHISNVESQIQRLTISQTGIEMDVNSASETPQTPLVGNTSLISAASGIADELADRERRKNNLIIYNLVEKSDREADKKAFTDLCQAVFSGQFTVTKVFRLGKRTDNNDRPRPLLVVFHDESDKNVLLASSPKLRHHDLYKNVYLSPDRTKFERVNYKKLVEELKLRRSNGENNLIIRNNSIIIRPTRPRSSAGNTTTSGSQPMAPSKNHAKPSSSTEDHS